MRKRPKKGLLAGLYEFPNVEGHLRTEEVIGYAQTAGLTPVRVKRIGTAKHIFSHIEWRMSGYSVCVGSAEAPAGCVWTSREQLQNEYTLPGAFKAYKKKLGL